MATTDWVLHVDSDEILRREDVAKIRKACSMFRKPEKPVTLLVQIISSASGRVSSHPASRMYKRNSFVWKGIVHEQLFHKRTDDCLLVETDIGFRHSGYDPDVVNTASKYLRNIELLEKGIEQEPTNQFYHFFLGRDYSLVGRHIEALPHLIWATKLLTNENIQYQKRVYSTLAECQQVLGDHDGLRRTVAVMIVQFGDEHHLH